MNEKVQSTCASGIYTINRISRIIIKSLDPKSLSGAVPAFEKGVEVHLCRSSRYKIKIKLY